MTDFLKVVVFVLIVLGLFAYVANSIPQQVSLPPVKENLDPATIKTKADMVGVGKKIFFGKGQCALCHAIGETHSPRAPNLDGVGGKLTREFIYETLTQPSKYIYLDYTHSPPKPFPARMPQINKPPVGLSEPELLAVMAFVQTLGGEVTIEPKELAAFLPPPVVKGDPAAGKVVFDRMGCAGCHTKLPDMLAKYTNEAALRAAAIRPAGITDEMVGKDGKRPHFEFDRKFSVKDLDDLIAYLEQLRPKQEPPKPAEQQASVRR